jgi:hypothetical protein
VVNLGEKSVGLHDWKLASELGEYRNYKITLEILLQIKWRAMQLSSSVMHIIRGNL